MSQTEKWNNNKYYAYTKLYITMCVHCCKNIPQYLEQKKHNAQKKF